MFSGENRIIRIGYTLGDLAGIGPEIFFKFIKQNQSRQGLEMILLDEGYQDLLDIIEVGKPCALSGDHAYKTLVKADALLKNQELDFLVTGPVSKESLDLAGIKVSGQTELLAQINNLTREEIEMFFILNEFRVVLATRHVPIADVSSVLEERLEAVIRNSTKALKTLFKIPNPKIAIAGLNPHAGENGIIGVEENKFMKPIIESFKKEINIYGPFPADTLFAQAARDYLCPIKKTEKGTSQMKFDLFIAAYHDQVLPLIKGLGGFSAINLTFGLPYIRLSVDHGTGFDIAGEGIASCAGLEACTDYCLRISWESSRMKI